MFSSYFSFESFRSFFFAFCRISQINLHLFLIFIFFNYFHKYFRTYSTQNCLNECERILLGAACNCSMYYMLQLDNDTDMCGKPQHECVHLAAMTLTMNLNSTFRCNCLPSCYDISYSSSMSMTPIFGSSDITKQTGLAKDDLVALSAFFAKSYYRAYNKDPTTSFTDFLCKQTYFVCVFHFFFFQNCIKINFLINIRIFMTFSCFRFHKFQRVLVDYWVSIHKIIIRMYKLR